MQMYPLKFNPIFKERIWGGRTLGKVFNKNLPADKKIGESWELADLPNDKSIIANGKLAGRTLRDVIKEYPEQITGSGKFSAPFPLLIKFLDAEDTLSVQVHPDSQTCRQMGKGAPKTECWYIIAAEPGAVIYKGLKKGVTKQHFADAVKTGKVAELLAKVPVNAGQCHFLPAGTAHAIGPGLLIAEIQTPSDTTYRLFDWNRFDDNGRPRQLHIEEALESIHFDASEDNLSVTTAGRLVDCEYFKIDKLRQRTRSDVIIKAGTMSVLIIISGAGKIIAEAAEPVGFTAGDTLLIPAAFEGILALADDIEYLAVTIT